MNYTLLVSTRFVTLTSFSDDHYSLKILFYDKKDNRCDAR
jgi:hypothetical protein